jgi:hypothetical protein
VPGDILAFDWGEEGKLFVFCAVLAWSRVRFVYFVDNCGAEATLNALCPPARRHRSRGVRGALRHAGQHRTSAGTGVLSQTMHGPEQTPGRR